MRARLIISIVTSGWLLLSACLIAAADAPSSQSVVYRDKQGVVSVDIAMTAIDVQRTEGGLKITASGSLEGRTVGLALVVPNNWDVTPMTRTDGKTQWQFLPAFVRIGVPSETLDQALQALFKLKRTATIFKSKGYRGVSLDTREQLENTKVKFSLGDHGVEGDAEWQFDIALDLPNKTMKLNVRETNR